MTTQLRVDHQVAVVTGAARGIGAAYARGLAEAGARVVLVDIDEQQGNETADSIRSDGFDAQFLATDVADASSVAELGRALRQTYGGARILVNNAALEGAPGPEPFLEIDPEKFDRVMAVNVKGMVLMARELAPGMKALGGGAIVNQSSIGAFAGYAGTLPYSSSKMAIIGLTRVMARELGSQNIRVNCIAPGVVATESVLELTSKDIMKQIVESQCIQELQQPRDLVDPLLFLVSEASRFVTGQTLIVDGGVVLSP